MGLALVTVTPADFDFIYSHLVSHKPEHGNMHLREACQRNNKRDLRYLHAMRPKPGDVRAIEGLISGPEVFWEYEIVRRRTPTQVNVISDEAPARERDRIEEHFLNQVMRRIRGEQAGIKYPPRFSPGQFYLRRHRGGMAVTHPTCTLAIAAGVVDEQFLATVLPWGFLLWRR